MKERKRIWVRPSSYEKLKAIASMYGISVGQALDMAIPDPLLMPGPQHEDLIGPPKRGG